VIRKILIVEDELIVAKDLEHILLQAGYYVCGIARSVAAALDIIERDQPEMVLLDIHLQGKLTGIDLALVLNEMNIAFVYLSANSDIQLLEKAKHTKPYGFMVKPFRDDEVIITLDIAHFRHNSSLETELRKEESLSKVLESIEKLEGPPENALHAVAEALQDAIPFDYLEIKSDSCSERYGFLRIGFKEYQVIKNDALQIISGLTVDELKDIEKTFLLFKKTAYYNKEQLASLAEEDRMVALHSKIFGLNSKLELPVISKASGTIYLSFYSKSDRIYNSLVIRFTERIAPALSRTLEKILHTETNENAAIVENITTENPKETDDSPFTGIVGKSQPLLSVLDFITQAATVDSSVLVLGETGTGKEQVARNIHNLSARSKFPLIRVNCAALPPNLIESELFGHEKGAFTDASQTREGLFEQAQHGTIFLDEIGDVPLETQVKLLRVLQEKEIQRVGGREIIKTDVRIIAATNKNLELEIAEGRFRMDLYYRLNVLPVYLPALRERGEDILLLADHFLRMYAGKYEKMIKGITLPVRQQLLQMDYPGNIRELENIMERSVVFTKGEFLDKIYTGSLSPAENSSSASIKTFDEIEKEHILSILAICNHKIYGEGGAAQLLNVPPSTLTSKMKKLGIKKK